MAHRRAVLVALLLAAGLARAATQGPPVYAYTGAAPSGSCTGTRVWIDAAGTGTYFCNAGTWAAASGSALPAATSSAIGGVKLSTTPMASTVSAPLVPTLNTSGYWDLNGYASEMYRVQTNWVPFSFQHSNTPIAGATTEPAWSFQTTGASWSTPQQHLFQIRYSSTYLGKAFEVWRNASNNIETASETFRASAASGVNGFSFATNGARFDLGTGSNDYFVSDGTNISTSGSLTATGGFVGNASTATALSTIAPVPATATTACTAGQVRADETYLYVCHATNTWRRVATSSW